MADVVLVVLRRRETAAGLLRAGHRIANLMGGATLNVLAVREPIQVTGLAAEAPIEEAESAVGAKAPEQQPNSALHEVFVHWMSETGTDARWAEIEGSAPAIIAEWGSRADLIVSGQPLEDDRPARQAFSAALFDTNRPVLLVPSGRISSFGRRVAIAWRDDKRAVRAVITALRCLSAAEKVHVLLGVRDNNSDPAMPKILSEHGIAAELHTVPIGSEPLGKTLLDTVHRLSADMLVMGAYAHSPLRELILGGVTRYVLDHADLPVLMRH